MCNNAQNYPLHSHLPSTRLSSQYCELLLALPALQMVLEWPELIRIECSKVQRAAGGA